MPQIEFINRFILSAGAIVKFYEPKEINFRIVTKIKEDNYQATQEEIAEGFAQSSYCAAKYLCEDESSNRALMRVYMQVPWINTESYPPEERQKQATAESEEVHMEVVALRAFWKKSSSITPALLGFKEGRQTASMPVPNGYIIYLVWAEVPGVHLGDSMGPTNFWKLPDDEKELIHKTFLRELQQV
ncbi:uncharacterized protein PFLUO_LOCUS6909 [Penicillium psychrofluorescens]|uniref:uncharacterized protein n=1 Tax=Penicillium psychrofluorescens TaxID=3158075 RepID=UPI003CCCB363